MYLFIFGIGRGFVINLDKFSLVPSQIMIHLRALKDTFKGIDIKMSPCLNQSRIDIWEWQWPPPSVYDATENFISYTVTGISRALTGIYAW